MLRTLKLHNFRTYLNAEISLAERHLLIGRNNSGKTNLVRAVKFLGATSTIDLTQAANLVLGGVGEMLNWRLKGDMAQFVCGCELNVDGVRSRYIYELDLTLASAAGAVSGELSVSREDLTLSVPGLPTMPLVRSDGHEAVLLEENHLDRGEPRQVRVGHPKGATVLSRLYESESNRRAFQFRRYLAGWSYYAFQPDAMRHGWQKPLESSALSVSGDNLAHVLYQLKNQDEVRYRRLLAHVQAVEPGLVAINFVPVPGQAPVPFVVLKDQPRASWLGLSDGTLRAMAMACVVELCAAAGDGGSSAPLCVIEEPENGIAPGVLRGLFNLFEERAPGAQFIFTSHSPYFIDLFDGDRDSVSLLRRAEDRTEVLSPSLADTARDADRLTLSEEYAMELIG